MGGDPDSCAGRRNHTRVCVGISGLARSMVSLIDSLMALPNTVRAFPDVPSYYVLEDDYFLNFTVANEYVQRYVPDDWEIIRFNPWMWRPIPHTFRRVNPQVVRNSHEGRTCNATATRQCWFCGGTHAMLWKAQALPKLRALWSKKPYVAIDCRLVTDAVVGYMLFLDKPMGQHNETSTST